MSQYLIQRFKYLLLLFCCVANTAHAQDTIRLFSGRYIAGRITDVGPYIVSYVPVRGPGRAPAVKRVSKSVVATIRYADGMLQPISLHRQQGATDTGIYALYTSELYKVGRSDA